LFSEPDEAGYLLTYFSSAGLVTNFNGFSWTYSEDSNVTTTEAGLTTLNFSISSDDEDFIGIVGNDYYGANYDLTDTNVYPQIGFVASLFPISTANTG